MEKETGSSTVLREVDKVGVVQIADDVVAMIAALAATEAEGVSCMAGNITNELISRIGVKKLARSVRVAVEDRKVKVALALTVEYRYSIPATCHQVQAKVKAAIENMTGLDCSDVNIRIAGVKVR